MARYIFITGGVVSSLGKGVSTASIGALLKAWGYRVTLQKMDPYLNIDSGTMNPFQHGEVFVTEDGMETDLDLGYYERFTSQELSRLNSVTTGQVYLAVIQRERRGEYLGRTIQVIPHITNEIQSRMSLLEEKDPSLDFILVEIGGTVGDIESIPFLEAIRQFRLEKGEKNTLSIHVTLVPRIYPTGELKTKPTQHSVKELQEKGIQPNILICRADTRLPLEIKKKISLFCNVPPERVISAPDIKESIYEVPLVYHEEGLDREILRYFGLLPDKPSLFQEEANPFLEKWREIVRIYKNPQERITLAMVGKYVHLKDAYKSLIEALSHGGIPSQIKVEIETIDSERLTPKNYQDMLSFADAILVPGGFGERGIDGKLLAIEYARKKKLPFLGICLGMQCAVIEFARNVLGWKEANSTEFDVNTPYPVISLLEEQEEIIDKGGTMRLGAYPCKISRGTLLYQIYQKEIIYERHRHRYEFTLRYQKDFEEKGMVFSGKSLEGKLIEAIELKEEIHPWFIGVQFHPEFKSSPLNPHPLFVSFVEEALKRKKCQKE